VLGGHLRHYIRYQLYNNYFTSVEKTTFIIDDVFSEFFNIIRRQRRHLSIMMAFSPIHGTFCTGPSRTESFSFQQYSNNDFFSKFFRTRFDSVPSTYTTTFTTISLLSFFSRYGSIPSNT
jgi:hypothetical protein